MDGMQVHYRGASDKNVEYGPTQTSLIFLIINYLIGAEVYWTGFCPYLPMFEQAKDSPACS